MFIQGELTSVGLCARCCGYWTQIRARRGVCEWETGSSRSGGFCTWGRGAGRCQVVRPRDGGAAEGSGGRARTSGAGRAVPSVEPRCVPATWPAWRVADALWAGPSLRSSVSGRPHHDAFISRVTWTGAVDSAGPPRKMKFVLLSSCFIFCILFKFLSIAV